MSSLEPQHHHASCPQSAGWHPTNQAAARIRTAALLIDELLAAGFTRQAAALDGELDSYLEALDAALDELEAESHDDGDWVTGIEDYEDAATWADWEPWMLVAAE